MYQVNYWSYRDDDCHQNFVTLIILSLSATYEVRDLEEKCFEKILKEYLVKRAVYNLFNISISNISILIVFLNFNV